VVFALWISVGSIVHAPTPTTLPVGLCVNNLTSPIVLPVSDDPLIELYLVSFAWYGVIGTGSAIIIGTIVSLATGGGSRAHRESVRPDLMYSMADNCCCCCPLACIQCYRCGVNYDEDDQTKLTKVASKSKSNQVEDFDDGVDDNMSASDGSRGGR